MLHLQIIGQITFIPAVQGTLARTDFALQRIIPERESAF
jgi:hypothetical protein